MVMHYMSILHYEHDATTYLGRIGFYGVCMFYVLSGLTLYIVYQNKMNNGFNSIKLFLLKRFFRIFPLLWLVIFFSVFRSLFFNNSYTEYGKLFLNLTGLFGFFSWSNYIGMGVWSIGNELVFYSLFPILIFALHKSKSLFFFIYLFSFMLFIYFTFFKLNDINASDYWHYYTNPLNHLFYFTSGLPIGVISKYKLNNKVLLSIFFSSVIFFLFWPIEGSEYNVSNGVNRVLFTLSSILISLFFLHRNISFPGFLKRFFSFLGEISYSIYLLHPIVITLVLLIGHRFFEKSQMNDTIFVSISLFLTLLSSYISYTYFEKYFILIGKKY